MVHQNLLERTAALLQSPTTDDVLAETLDQSVMQLSLSAESSLPSWHQYEYSKQLVQAKIKVKIWKLQLTQLRTSIPMEEKIEELKAEADLEVEPMTVLADGIKQYREAIKEV